MNLVSIFKSDERGRGVLSRFRASEDGVTIIELLIAMTIFAVVASGVAVGMGSALGLTRNNRNRSVAANLAAKEMDVVRSTKFESLALTQQVKTETVDNVVYTITRDTSWVSKDGTGGVCSPPAGTALAFLKVVVSVAWPDMSGVEPVKSETILAPPIGAYDSDTGHLAVRIRDRAGAPLNGQVVTAVGPGGTFTQTTVNGCAFFVSLTPGNFTVSLNTANYVSGQGLQNPSQVLAVTAGSITSAEFDYDQKATLSLNLVGLTNYGVPEGLGATVANTSLSLGTQAFSPPSSSSCTAPTTTVTSTGDAYVTQASPSTNAGTSTTYGTYSDDTSDTRSLVKFTLPTVPAGCSLNTATLRLYNNFVTAGRTINVLQANAAWTETGVTWNNQPSTTGSAVAATSPSAQGWMTWGVTTIVSAQYAGTNNGFLIRDNNEASNDVWVGFHPRELANDPELVLTWIDNPAPITLPTSQMVTATPLFPYPNGYQAWGGVCLDADPQGVNPSGGQPYYPGAQRETAIVSNPNQTTVANVTLKSVDILVKLSNNAPVGGVIVKAVHDPDSGCAQGTTLVLGTTGTDGYVHVALPYGTWRFQVDNRTAVGSWPAPQLSPLTGNPQTVTVTVN